ncbi:DNA topoisomerase medium subunit [Klebsiella phage CPRSA]|nr:DNA topoisomerase medium subunit [Klebsiella phage CPRSA]
MERSIKDVVQVEGLTFALYTIYSRAIRTWQTGLNPFTVSLFTLLCRAERDFRK